jgi:hypothetical protein
MVYCGPPPTSLSAVQEAQHQSSSLPSPLSCPINKQAQCDKKKGSCGQCTRTSLTCPGHHNPQSLTFGDETPKVIRKLLTWTAPRASIPLSKTEPNTSFLLVTCSVILHLWTGSSLSTRLREKTSVSATPSKLSVRLSLQRGWLFCRPAKSTQSLLPRLVTHQIKLCILKAPLRKQHPPRGPAFSTSSRT